LKIDNNNNCIGRRDAIRLAGTGALAALPLGKGKASLFSLCDDERGMYFPKKEYVEEPLPTFEGSKGMLPRPVLDGSPGLVELYWTCWRMAFDHLKRPTPENGFVSNYLDEAFNPNIFQWDTIFMVMFARYGHHLFPAVQSLDNFYAKQHKNGFICREIWETDGRDHFREFRNESVNPPLFSWAEMESFRLSGDKRRLADVALVLEKYTAWLETARKKKRTAHGLYWNNGLGSGMDNTPRKGSGWVDMSSQMVMQYRDLGRIHEVLGDSKRAESFSARAAEIGKRINRWMWNEEDGLYYDVDNRGEQVKWKTAASFWPMLAGVTSPGQEERLIANLKDPDAFWRMNVFPTLAADQEHYDPTGRYWKGGVWAPTNYMIVRGLAMNGHHKFAAEAAGRYVGEIHRVYEKTGTVWELYAPDIARPGTGSQGESGLHQARPDFVGWTGCGPIAMLIENMIGIDADAMSGTITWRLGRSDRFGIEDLWFGGRTVSLVCEERASAASPATLRVSCDKAFKLVLVRDGIERSFDLSAGDHDLSF